MERSAEQRETDLCASHQHIIFISIIHIDKKVFKQYLIQNWLVTVTIDNFV
jgi:hypothetical protein